MPREYLIWWANLSHEEQQYYTDQFVEVGKDPNKVTNRQVEQIFYCIEEEE